MEYKGIIYQNIVKGMKVLIDAKSKLGNAPRYLLRSKRMKDEKIKLGR